MLRSSITSVVDLCVRRAWWVIVVALALAAGTGDYAARHFAIHTDVNDLISPNLPWAQRALQYAKEFPQRDILVVIDASTPENAEQAASRLASALRGRPDLIRAINQPGSGDFFEHNGLLFLPTDQLRRVTEGMSRADVLLETLTSDPSLRGALDALSLAVTGVQRGDIKLDEIAQPANMAADTVQAALADHPASFSWRILASGRSPKPGELRRFLQVEPVLNFRVLEPGRAASEAITQLAANLNLAGEYQARVRQTGRIPIDDDEFATIKQNAGLNAVVSLIAVAIILVLALRSWRIIFAVALSLFVGLIVSTALGLFLVGALNVISVAFFVLFVGLGIDFGIQFSVRYRAERHDHPDLHRALLSAAKKAGSPLALAAMATAVGFSSFLPTAYRGLSELGEIAGAGMIVAFIASITLLPALLAVLKPPGEQLRVGFAALAPVDRFLERHRIAVILVTVLAVVLASPLLWLLRFDFDPLHLRNTKVESVATYLELRSDPQTGANAIDIVAPNLTAANATARRLSALPQVAQTRTLSSLIPDDQDEKLALIRTAATAISPSLNPGEIESPPTDQDEVDALSSTADSLAKVAAAKPGRGAEVARRLSGLLSQLAKIDPTARERAATAVVQPLRFSLGQLRAQLKAQRISSDTIPADLAREWITPDGRARVEVLPKGDPDNTDTLRNFVQAVLSNEPNATGPAVVLFEAGNTAVRAFIQSGIFALSAIALLLWVALRRISDVLLTLVPLLVAGIVTLELCVVLDLPLNFANIIAFPLLLGVGVAFKIYYIMAWRAGRTGLLQSSLTRAVVFSSMTTATAFGSLWLSSHPGTSSMGELMALALICTMMAAVLFQPALMDPPRQRQ
jgi:uncharacterized protein